MHILAEQIRSLDETVPAVDLGQTPADVVFLSFSDSDLALAATVHTSMSDEPVPFPHPEEQAQLASRRARERENGINPDISKDPSCFETAATQPPKHEGSSHQSDLRKPTLRLASLSALQHPYSVDLYIERVVQHARFVLVRCLGGQD